MELQPHPSSSRGPVARLMARTSRGAGGELRVAYRLDADLAQLRLPAPAVPARADGLWRHTCFEAFVGLADAAGYLEFNFSPSSQWAAYSFSAYREGLAPLDVPDPQIAWRREAGWLELMVALPLPPGQWAGSALRMALSAVIEEQSGTISYWALRHPAGPPDFHHPEAFRLVLETSGEAPREAR